MMLPVATNQKYCRFCCSCCFVLFGFFLIWQHLRYQPPLSEAKKGSFLLYREIHLSQSRSSDISPAWPSNTATSAQLRPRLNTPANFQDTDAYSPPHLSIADVPPNTAKQPQVTISWRWPEVNEISHIRVFLIRTISAAVFLIKPPYGNWFGTKAPLGGWRRSDA